MISAADCAYYVLAARGFGIRRADAGGEGCAAFVDEAALSAVMQ